ncbi:MAG: hypothetical protein V1839_03225 [archaeon]
MESALETMIDAQNISHVKDLPVEVLNNRRGIDHKYSSIIIKNALKEKPMTFKELEENTGVTHTAVTVVTRDLMSKDEVRRFKLCGNSGNGVYNCQRLFGKTLTAQTYHYRTGEDETVAELIIKHLPLDEAAHSRGMQRAVSLRLKHCLQPELYESVHFYCSKAYKEKR